MNRDQLRRIRAAITAVDRRGPHISPSEADRELDRLLALSDDALHAELDATYGPDWRGWGTK